MSPATTIPFQAPSTPRAVFELFFISLLVLFLELACIRWFPAHVLYLAFFTNMVLLACFLGMCLGCLAADSKKNFLLGTPLLLAAALAVAHFTPRLEKMVDIGNQAAPQVVFFGTEYRSRNIDNLWVPIEALGGCFFLLIALAMVGPGQELGRALQRLPRRVLAYTVNILGSIVGIVLFAACSWWELSPLWWFVPIGVGLSYFLVAHVSFRRPATCWGLVALLVFAVPALAAVRTGTHTRKDGTLVQHFWSPYYRVNYYPPPHSAIEVNLISHQRMLRASDGSFPAYALPHVLQRDSGGQPFADVLIIGAGSGNDVSRALQWGAQHVDAVEIDPVIHRLGRQDHPEHPYQDERVHVHLDDGRNFLRASERKYDLIVYALVDSLILHSSYSNIRLESYLFTRQAFEDVRRHLKPNGMFVMYNFFRQGWIVARLHKGLEEAFGAEPLVVPLPYRETIQPDQMLFGEFAMFLAGNTGALQAAFQKQPHYWLPARLPITAATPDGFNPAPADVQNVAGERFGLARVIVPEDDLRTASDAWPFLYLRRPMIPDLGIRGMAVMGGLTLLLVYLFLPKRQGAGSRWAFDGRMFFLGAGFMLMETKAVVHMALLFGSTWMVNSVVFFAVLVMILAANLFVLIFRPERLWPYYLGLLAFLAANCLVPLDFFLGMDRWLQVAGSCLLLCAPILFAGVIFAVSFSRVREPDRAFAANIAGAMLGGLAEYTSMLLGFQYLLLVAIAFYALSAVFQGRTPGDAVFVRPLGPDGEADGGELLIAKSA